MKWFLACACLSWLLSSLRADDWPMGPPPRELAPPPRESVPPRPYDLKRPPSPLVEMREHLQRLKDERNALHEDQSSAIQVLENPAALGQDLSRLRRRLTSLLGQLEATSEIPPPRPLPILKMPGQESKDPPSVEPKEPLVPKKDAKPPAAPTSQDPPPVLSPVADPLALAQALFRAGNYQGTWQAFRLVPLEGLKAQERAPVQYLMATCLRKLGKTDQAAELYRDVGNSRGDDVVAGCAQWQLQHMRWRKELTDQLQQIHQRRLALEKTP